MLGYIRKFTVRFVMGYEYDALLSILGLVCTHTISLPNSFNAYNVLFKSTAVTQFEIQKKEEKDIHMYIKIIIIEFHYNCYIVVNLVI